ncbi:hypothetical protein L6R52_01130 [Myxococcota bacterium]|nr:hypothetical protein [Myxococcota bacterium]
MADLGIAVGALIEPLTPLIGPLVKRAAKSFFVSTAGMIAAGVVTAAIAAGIASPVAAWHGAIAALATVALFGGLGAYLALQRAVGGAILAALEELGLGKKLLDKLFGQLLQVRDTEQHAERGISVARVAERLPLKTAESLLTTAVDRFVAAEEGARGPGAWLRRRISTGLMKKIEALTLGRFRDADAREGGVDLVKVRDELAEKVDEAAADQVRGMLLRVTLLAVGAATGGSLVVAALIRTLALR